MYQFCPKCGQRSLVVLDEVGDDMGVDKTILACNSCLVVVHVFQLEPIRFDLATLSQEEPRPDDEVPIGYELDGDYEGGGGGG